MSSYGISKKRQIRIQKNSKDKSTIVSIYPKSFKSEAVTVFPGRFIIPAGSVEKPGILVIGMSSYFKDDHQSQESIEVPISSGEMAKSIISDFIRALESANYPTQGPGVFFVEGEYTGKTIDQVEGYKEKIQAALHSQDLWYKELVKRADIMWSRNPGNPLAISNDARRAAEYLNLKDKAWMQDQNTYEKVPCKFCGTLKNPTFPVCPNCHQVTDPTKYAMLNNTNAKKSEEVAVK